MSQQLIDTSTQTDLLYQGFEKTNDNFTEVYQSILRTGMMIDYWGASAPSGWVFIDGQTIGDGSSGATGRANADTESLFLLLWASLGELEAPVSGGRGASAAADWAAHKTLTLPNLAGRVVVGKDSGTFSTLGDEIGAETHTLTESELPSVAAHTHTIGDAVGVATGTDHTVFATSTSSPSSSQSSGGFGSGSAHNNIQPSIVCNKIIKL